MMKKTNALKRAFWIFTLIFVLGTYGTCLAGEVSVFSGFGYSAWESDEDESGSQFYVPVTITGTFGDLSFHGLITHVASDLDIPEADTESVAGLIDTKVGMAYEITDRLPVDLLLALDVNLPTGQTGLSEVELATVRDSDLLAVATLGEGFNINPTVTVAKEIGQWALGVGMGYVFRGEYDYTETLTEYDPGDIFNIVVETNWQINDRWRMRLFGEQAWYQANQREGKDYSQNGDYLLIGLGADYEHKDWLFSLTITPVFREKSKYTVGSQSLATESRNSHGDEWNLAASGSYRLNDKTMINAGLDVIQILENDYSQDSAYYRGQRTKYALKAGFTRALQKNFILAAELSGFSMEEDEAWYFADDRSYFGYAMVLHIGKQF